MRILTFSSLFPNQGDPTFGIFIYQRSKHLKDRSNQVIVVSPVPYIPGFLKFKRWLPLARISRQEEFGGLSVFHPRYFLLPKVSILAQGVLIFLGSLPLVWRLNQSQRFDVIDAHFVYPDGFAAVLLGRLLRVPVAVSARGSDINLYSTFWGVRRMIQWTLTRAHHIIAVSDALKLAIERLGINDCKVKVIPNGIDSESFYPIDSSESRRKLGLPSDTEFIVSVGSLTESKGQELLIRAFSKIAPKHPKLQLFLIGDGPTKARLEALISSLNLREKVHLTGKRPNDELKFWFAAALASCLASEREGWPNSISESLACGTPVVSTRVGGVPEIINSDELGILVEQRVDSFADGLEKAISKKWDRKQISKVGRSRTWAEVASEVESVLSNVGDRTVSARPIS